MTIQYEPIVIKRVDFRSLSKKEKISYKNQLLEQIPSRLEYLQNLVSSDPEYMNWQMDYSPESLITLGEWLQKNLTTRPLTETEIEEIQSSLVFEVEFDRFIFTDLTYSMIFDVSMYFAEIMTKNYPQIEWVVSEFPKRGLDYGAPVLSGFAKKMSFMPQTIVGNSSQKQDGIYSAYKIWESYVPDNFIDPNS